ncbi:MAG: PilZ domain-containing protein [Phycisphaerae bacterium]|nr:PilZ domain-containing protein [Phycisphaerae bacterium]
MVRDPLERRRDPRTQANLPIMIRVDGAAEKAPAHLVDLSSGGAAVVMTAFNAPGMGDYLDLQFETPGNNEDGEPRRIRHETAVVMNVGRPERGIARLGLRFIQCCDPGLEIFDPIDTLSDHRRSVDPVLQSDRWESARKLGSVRNRRSGETASAF